MSCSVAQGRFLTFALFTTETPAGLRGLVSQNIQTQVRDAKRRDAYESAHQSTALHFQPRLDRLTNPLILRLGRLSSPQPERPRNHGSQAPRRLQQRGRGL